MRRTLGTAQRQVRPITVPDLRAMLEGLDTDPGGCRDRALLLLGFAGALRRSELVGLDAADVVEATCTSGARRPTRRAPGAPSVFLMGRT
jgi:site-specific recombinase XerC